MILVVEDEALVSDMVCLNLEHAGFDVQAYKTAEAALEHVPHAELLILDRMLPGMDGLAFARHLRAAGVTTPILMLTARGEVAARVAGLDAGADDYLAKPFAMPELLARVRALRRRAQDTAPRTGQAAHAVQAGSALGNTARTLRFDKYTVNLNTREALTNDGVEVLTETECQLLVYFHEHAGDMLSRADILESVWGMDKFPTARTVDNYVLRLRKLFEPDPENPRYLITVRGRGYVFRTESPESPA